jgi:hypothetical protein
MKRATNKTLQEGLEIFGTNIYDIKNIYIDVYCEGKKVLWIWWDKEKQVFVHISFSQNVILEEIKRVEPLFTTKKEELINWIKEELL